MDYVLGGVAALLNGNVTPSRPKLTKRALTPTKHQPSPNVTPKSQMVEDRSILLSPSVQKKKAIIKKSPKRIFQNPDSDEINESDGNKSLSSPKANKVKKHLKKELNGSITSNSADNGSTPSKKKHNKSKESWVIEENTEINMEVNDGENSTLDKTKKIQSDIEINQIAETKNQPVITNEKKIPKKRKNKKKKVNSESKESNVQITEEESSPKKKKISVEVLEKADSELKEADIPEKKKQNQKKKTKKRNKKAKQNENIAPTPLETEKGDTISESHDTVNPNAITNQDSDSEHESDDELASENEESNKAVLNTEPAESSDDEEEVEPQKEEKKDKKEVEVSEEEVKRTLFVGNVPFTKKCKKEIKKIFSKHGAIESVRIRTIPVKDARVTPKLAVIKNELHPDRTTVNVYIKFKDAESVDKALVENNTVLDSNHLRVSRSDTTGASHDPKCSVFVGNIPFGLEDEGLREKFQNCGEIDSVRIIRDKKTNAGKGFGYVNFSSKDGVELALALTEEDLTIKNRILRVKRCTQLTHKQTSKDTKVKTQGNQSFDRPQGGRGGFGRGGSRGGFASRGSNRGFDRADGNSSFRGRGGSNRGFGRSDEGRGGFVSRGGNRGFGGRGGSRGFGGRGGSRGFGGRGGSRGGGRGGYDRNQNEDRQGHNDESQGEGAYRRILHKRKIEEGNTDSQANVQAPKEKKVRKEFVGVTAEKKKKHKFDKGQKKKKALSEILTK